MEEWNEETAHGAAYSAEVASATKAGRSMVFVFFLVPCTLYRAPFSRLSNAIYLELSSF
jgi:hypothetical protein